MHAAPIQTPQTSTGHAPNPFVLQPRLTGYVNAIIWCRTPTPAVTAIDEVTQYTLCSGIASSRTEAERPFPSAIQPNADIMQGSSRIMALLLANGWPRSRSSGGIGIMNILPRVGDGATREIGLRMRLERGAFTCFCTLEAFEAAFFERHGGAAGILAGIAASRDFGGRRMADATLPAAIAADFCSRQQSGSFSGITRLASVEPDPDRGAAIRVRR